MKYCLIDCWRPSYILPKDSRAVALTQEAIFYLEQCGIKYITLEEFYTSGQIRSDADDFLFRQLSWFNDFDQFLKEIFPEANRLNINLASIYYYWIKYKVDTVIVTVRILKRFIEFTKPTKIYFISKQYKEDKIDHILSFENTESVYSRLVEPLCKKYKIDFQRIAFDRIKEQQDFLSMWQFINGRIDFGELKRLIKRILPNFVISYRNKLIQELRYLGIALKSSCARHKIGNIFVLRSDPLINDFCIETRKQGFNLFFKKKDTAKKLSLWPWAKRIKINQARNVKVRKGLIWTEILHRLSEGKIMQWINNQCGSDVSSSLKSRFEYFLQKICPEIIARTQDYLDFYVKNKIDFVVTCMVWTTEEHAALAAARLTKSTKIVGIAHGADAYESKIRFFYLIRQFDLYFCFSKGEADTERALAESLNYKYPKIYEYPYFQKRYFQNFAKRRKSGKKPIVVFVPIISTPWPNRPIELIQPTAMEYVSWHKALVEYFSKRDDYFFIWKGCFRPGQTFDIIGEITRQNCYKNIQFHSNRLTHWLPVADRVLLDVPSTAFFEAIYSRLPVMAFYRPADERLRKNAFEEFGLSVRGYTNIDEGLKLVDEFLNGEPQKYIVPVFESKVSISKILEPHLST